MPGQEGCSNRMNENERSFGTDLLFLEPCKQRKWLNSPTVSLGRMNNGVFFPSGASSERGNSADRGHSLRFHHRSHKENSAVYCPHSEGYHLKPPGTYAIFIPTTPR